MANNNIVKSHTLTLIYYPTPGRMTEREGSAVSYSAQHIDELLRCPVCLDRFNTPKLLPCQHTFCESPCLEHLVDR